MKGETSSTPPLDKDSSGTAIRPIALPSVHRKVFAKTTVASYQPQLREAAGQQQHAAMCPHGTVRMARLLQQHARSARHEAVYIRTDIRNAFNEVNRQAALQALDKAHPELAQLHYAWLHRPTTAIMPATTGCRQTLLTHAGIPQGDPLQQLSVRLGVG